MNAPALAADFHDRLGRLPLRRKFQYQAYLIALAAALAVSAVFAGYRLMALRGNALASALAITRIVAENATGPAAFQDSSAGSTVLASLRAEPSVASAVIDLPGKPGFAVFGRPPAAAQLVPPGTNSRFRGWVLTTAADIGDEEKGRARLQIVSDLRPQLWSTLGAVGLAFLTALVLALLLGDFVSNRLRRFILGPIEKLHAATHRIGAEAGFGHRVPVTTRDELGDLTLAFNRMLDRLQAADSELRQANDSLVAEVAERRRLEKILVDTSRQAGMAEVATGILHNVGNVLNSVNISAQLMRDKIGRSQLFNLKRAAEMIEAQGEQIGRFIAEDPRGRKLPQFLITLAAELQSEQTAASQELARLARNIEHIKEIVAAQQGFARVAGVTEILPPRELFEEAERIAGASVLRHGVEIVHEYEDPGPIHVDRHQALQILVNFITNAVHAVKANAPGDRRITLRLTAGPGRVVLSVIDNGVGIQPDNLARIFTHGFTTRHDGHGFGLHSGALAAKALGGAVRVESEGPGRGATFAVELPTEPPSHRRPVVAAEAAIRS